MVWVIAFALLINNHISRGEFLSNYVEMRCSISSHKIVSGRSNGFEISLSCPDRREARIDQVDPDFYEAHPVGQKISIYSSKKNPNVWEFFRPTEDWLQTRNLQVWSLFAIVSGTVCLIFKAIWNVARNEEKFLREASILEAEVIDMKILDGKAASVELHIKFEFEGRRHEMRLPGNTSNVSQYFDHRLVKIAVRSRGDSLLFAKVLCTMAMAELAPEANS